MGENPEATTEEVSSFELREQWSKLSLDEKKETFFAMDRVEAEELFLNLSSEEQCELILDLAATQKRSWLRLLAPDDVADLIQKLPDDQRGDAVGLLDPQSRRDVLALLAYAEDDAGGLMNPQFIRLRPDMSVEEAIRYLRAQARSSVETIYYAYVLDSQQKLQGVLSFRDLFLAAPGKSIQDIMSTDLISVHEEMDREEVSRLFTQHNLMAIPVVDPQGVMKGIVTHDDIVEVVQQEATEDIQKLGGMEALDAPYLKISFFNMLKKRVGWLTILFFGEMLTASAMARYEADIARAVVLALFIPLIISSGGNSGSQASTLIIRALALQEIHLKDWGRVLWREFRTGIMLGLILGCIGFLKIILLQNWSSIYGEHYLVLALSVSVSLVGVVLWGSLAGSMLPFVLRKFNFDPASASAPFVATMVDVTGLVIYFSIASFFLKGTLL